MLNSICFILPLLLLCDDVIYGDLILDIIYGYLDILFNYGDLIICEVRHALHSRAQGMVANSKFMSCLLVVANGMSFLISCHI